VNKDYQYYTSGVTIHYTGLFGDGPHEVGRGNGMTSTSVNVSNWWQITLNLSSSRLCRHVSVAV